MAKMSTMFRLASAMCCIRMTNENKNDEINSWVLWDVMPVGYRPRCAHVLMCSHAVHVFMYMPSQRHLSIMDACQTPEKGKLSVLFNLAVISLCKCSTPTRSFAMFLHTLPPMVLCLWPNGMALSENGGWVYLEVAPEYTLFSHGKYGHNMWFD